MKKLLIFAVLLSVLTVSALFSAVPCVLADADNNVPADSEGDPIIGKWDLEFYSTVNENGITQIVSSNLFNLMLGYDSMRLEINSDGSVERTQNAIDWANVDIISSSAQGIWQKGNNGTETDVILENGDSYSCANEESTDYLDCLDANGTTWTFQRAAKTNPEESFIPKPNVVPVSKESDFFGEWQQMYMYSSDLPSIYERESGTSIMRMELPNHVSISSGYLFWSRKLSNQEISSDTYLRNGRLETNLVMGDEKIIFELNDNGMLSVSWDGSTFYFVKESDGSTGSAEEKSTPVLTVTSHELETGDHVEVEVSAPGADRITLYDGSFMKYEEKGESLYHRFGSYSPSTITFYAEAFYNGEPVKSNEETVRFVEPSSAKVETPAQEESHAVSGIETPVPEESHAEALPEASPAASAAHEAEAAAPAAAPEKGISLSAAGTDVPVGSNAGLTVNAPGADGIKIYRSDTNQLMKKSEGDHLEYQFTVAEAKTMSLYAIASYGGVWSDVKSNEVTIRFY